MLEGTGASHANHASPMHGRAGRPVPVSLDLTWTTAGTPYRYSILDRYEVPCDVEGLITVDGETLRLAGPGQRDHSWGVRDWWSVDWMWTALRLDDGTRMHALHVRPPQGKPFSVGYVQDAGGTLTEISGIEADEHVSSDGLVDGARIVVNQAGLDLSIEPVASGPLRFTSPDGRSTAFPRAMCRVVAADGRTGLGWTEWGFAPGSPRPLKSASAPAPR